MSSSSIKGSSGEGSAPPVEIRRHSTREPWTYAKLDQRQREIAARVREGGTGALLVSEVAPVITLGRRTSPSDIVYSESQFRARGVELVRTDRGGLATYHGPGQWVLFPVDTLERLTGDSRGVRRAVQALLEAALAVAKFYEPCCEIREEGRTGVWSPRGKVASVGVHIDQRVLLHGVSLNGFRTPESFIGIRPCGLDAQVDFLLDHDQSSVASEFEALGMRFQEELLKRLWV